MKKFNLGKTGLRVSRVGAGGIPLTRSPMNEAVRLIRRALDLEVNFFNTSLAYKDSEIRIGKGIEGRRDEVFIAKKGSNMGKEKARGTRDVGFIAMKPFATGFIKKASLAVKYLLQFDNVLPDPGIQSIREIDEIVGIVEGPWGLTPGERREIEETHSRLCSRFCRHCELCTPCPRDVMIPELLYLPMAWELKSHEWFLRSKEGLFKS